MRFTTIAIALVLLPGCSPVSRPHTPEAHSARSFTTTVWLHGQPLELHLTAPRTPVADHLVVLYASGDGGWFGAAVDMFRQIGEAGYPAVGFSARAFLKMERPPGALVNAAQLAAAYEEILTQARSALGLDDKTRTVVTGWSRGAAFAVLVAAEHPVPVHLAGVVAIGLADGEDLDLNGPGGGSDDGGAAPGRHRWPFDTYERILQIDPIPCAVIQATHDGYFPAAEARQRFGPDTPRRRFYAIEAANHRFSGGKPAFHAALLEALHWIAAPAVEPPETAARSDAYFRKIWR